MPRPVVTVMSEMPLIPSGTVAVICVGLSTTTPVAAVPPIVTPVAPVKSVPVMTTVVPPASGARAGATEVMVGAAGGAERVMLMV